MKDPYSRGAHTSRRTAQFNISFGKVSQFLFTRHIDTTHVTEGLVYFNTTGSPISYAAGGSGKSVRLDVYPDGGKWNNKTTYHWQNNQGFLYSPHSIGSGEFTTFVRVHGDLHILARTIYLLMSKVWTHRQNNRQIESDVPPLCGPGKSKSMFI